MSMNLHAENGPDELVAHTIQEPCKGKDRKPCIGLQVIHIRQSADLTQIMQKGPIFRKVSHDKT